MNYCLISHCEYMLTNEKIETLCIVIRFEACTATNSEQRQHLAWQGLQSYCRLQLQPRRAHTYRMPCVDLSESQAWGYHQQRQDRHGLGPKERDRGRCSLERVSSPWQSPDKASASLSLCWCPGRPSAMFPFIDLAWPGVSIGDPMSQCAL